MTPEEFQWELKKMKQQQQPIWVCKIDVTSEKKFITEENTDLKNLGIEWKPKDRVATIQDHMELILCGTVETPTHQFEYEITAENGSYEIVSSGMVIFQKRADIPESEYLI